ncbi:MAG: class I SAM-dependent methyltransferase [Candidatus Bathyarchaeia archaeon]
MIYNKKSQFLALKVKIIRNMLKGIFTYRHYDSDEYWRKRASPSDSLFWYNVYYNKCFREKEFEVIRSLIEKYEIQRSGYVLDIGCGKGDISKFLVELGFQQIDAVDFPEMIKLAKEVNPHSQINYISSSAQDYLVDKKYNLIVSSAVFSMIRDIQKMFKAINNCIAMLGEGGYLLMIDAFHNSNLLARAKISADEVIKYVERNGLKLLEKGGMLFWPTRIFVSNDKSLTEYQTRILFKVGEGMLAKLGEYTWSDYKILLFKRF